MLLLSCRNIKKSFGELKVLKGVDLDIRRGERVGLVGKNGAGKTTLVEILSGNLKADEGTIIKHQENLKTGYLLQATSYTQGDFEKMFQNKGEKMGDFLKVTSHLGLESVQGWEGERFKGISGGERTKLALASIWMTRPDLLILDEPTNHLDYRGVEWLIAELKTYDGAIIVISHDRYFLDQIVERIIELEAGKLNEFSGNYSDYRREKKRRYQVELHHYEEQLKQERKLEEQISRLDNWAQKGNNQARKKAIDTGMKFGGKEFYRAKAAKLASQYKSKRKRLEKLRREGVARPEEEREINFNLIDPQKRGRRVIEARNLTKGFGDRQLFRDSSFYILSGEKLGIYGPNGCGKTTLVRMITGQETPDSGELWVSKSLQIGYLSQEVADLNGDKTPMEALAALQGFYNSYARNLLFNLGFDESMLTRPIKKLSLGERTRLKLADLILKKSDCLLLDEPTNHLDLYSREELEENLRDYQGTIILVTHDRYLLEKLCDKLLVFSGKEINRFEGNFWDYWAKRNMQVKNSKGTDPVIKKEELLLIEIRLARILSQFEKYTPEDPEYQELDREYQELLNYKKELTSRK